MRKLSLVAFVLPLLAANAPTVPSGITLGNALSMALTTDTLVSAQQAVSLAQRVAEHAASLPRVGVLLTATEEPEAGLVFPKYTQVGALGLDFGSPLSRIGAVASTRAAVQQSVAGFAGTRRDAARVLIDVFFAVADDRAQTEAQSTAVSLASRALSAAVDRRKTGAAPLLDVERAQSALATAQAELASAQENLAGDEQILGILIRRADPPTPIIPPTPTTLPDVATVSDAAIRFSPMVASAQASFNAARAAAMIARGAVQPGFALTGGVGRSQSGSLRSTTPVAGVNINIPIGTSSNRADIASSNAAMRVAEAALEQSRRETVELALRARTAAAAQLARLPRLKEAFVQAQRVADADLAAYRLGAVSSADVVLAQSQLATARSALQTAEVEASLAFAELQLQMGQLPT
jgi:outer membrane protein TolC